ncbi:hypothetical protein F2P56_007415, partial [Juglans regia]
MLIQRGSDFLQSVKVLASELIVIDAPLFTDDITLYVLNELGLDFKDIVAPIRAQEYPLNFEKLYNLLVGHESYLKRMDFATATLVATVNSTQWPYSQECPLFTKCEPSAHCATNGCASDKKWLVDSAASHTITSDLSNLSIHSEYDGTNEVVIGDGS